MVRVVREQGGQVGQGHTVLGVLDVLWVLWVYVFLVPTRTISPRHAFLVIQLPVKNTQRFLTKRPFNG